MLCASSRCPFLWSLDSLLIWKGQAGLGVECLPSMREPWVNCLVLQRQQTPVWKEGNSMSLRHLFSWPSYLGHGPLDNMRGGLRILAWISDWNSHWLITLSPAHPTERTDCFLWMKVMVELLSCWCFITLRDWFKNIQWLVRRCKQDILRNRFLCREERQGVTR